MSAEFTKIMFQSLEYKSPNLVLSCEKLDHVNKFESVKLNVWSNILQYFFIRFVLNLKNYGPGILF